MGPNLGLDQVNLMPNVYGNKDVGFPLKKSCMKFKGGFNDVLTLKLDEVFCKTILSRLHPSVLKGPLQYQPL